jgi:hypothetical protein
MRFRHVFRAVPPIAAALMLALALLIAACQTSTGPDRNTGPSTPSGTGSIAGSVHTGNGAPACGVEVRVGDRSTRVNTRGEYFLDKIPAGDRVLVNFSGDGTTPTQKVTAVRAGRTSWVDAASLPWGAKQSIDAAAGGTVTFGGGASVSFPADAFVDAQGQPYAGSALVSAACFDPTGAQFFGAFPGDFSGLRSDGSTTGLESFGFARIDISGGGGALQLASGKEASIVFPIPSALQGRAPSAVPLWRYDESTGRWMEEGTATRNGNIYRGTVKHVSSWSCDQPTALSNLEGVVVDAGGQPIASAAVHATGVEQIGSWITITDDGGRFRIAVPSSSTVRIWARYYALVSAQRDEATPATGMTRNIGTITIPVDTTDFCTITGRIVDNGGLALSNVFVMHRDSIGSVLDYMYPSADGRFEFSGRTGRRYQVLLYWYSDSSAQNKLVPFVCPSIPGTMDLGDIAVDIRCATVVGRVVDSTGLPTANALINCTEGSLCGILSGGEGRTNASGRFVVTMRPFMPFKLYIGVENLMYPLKRIIDTSGALGSTLDLGDIVYP